jgi:O6-methylguanine-DNA--protein-cysteine methyltransferase
MKIQIKEIFTDRLDQTPLGMIWIAVCEQRLMAIQIGGNGDHFSQKLAGKFGVPVITDHAKVEIPLSQIEEYLQGKRKSFSVPILWNTMYPFQQKALKAVAAIPSGETRTYSQIAAEIGIPTAPRAVGRANATNPIPWSFLATG